MAGDKTICLAVSPSLKAKGIPGRPRLFEVKQILLDHKMRTGEEVHYISVPVHFIRSGIMTASSILEIILQ